MNKILKRYFINFLVKHLFNTITEVDVLRSYQGKLIHKGKVLNDNQRLAIISGAKILRDDSVLRLILEDMVFVANKKIFFDSKSTEDMVAGKLLLYYTEVLQKKIENLSNL